MKRFAFERFGAQTRRFILFLSFGLALAGCQSAQVKPAWEVPAGVKVLEANGYPIAYAEKGSGPTVVFVHGAMNDYRAWAPQMEALASSFRVVSMSLRHYYPERWQGAGEFSLKVHATDVAAFIEKLGAGPVHLVGWSRAGPIAADVARTRPDLVRKLVLMDPAMFALVAAPGAKPEDDPRVKRAKATEVFFKRGDIEGGLQYFYDDVNGQGAWMKLPEAQRQIRRDNAWTVVGQIGDVETVDCDDLGKLRMPVLLMGGENSPPLFKKVGGAVQRCLPATAKVLTVPKAGHAMHQANAAFYHAELAKFLAD